MGRLGRLVWEAGPSVRPGSSLVTDRTAGGEAHRVDSVASLETRPSSRPGSATNCSGPTAFLTDDNSYPLRVARRLPGGMAEPSVADVAQAMKRVRENPAEARRKGERARDLKIARGVGQVGAGIPGASLVEEDWREHDEESPGEASGLVDVDDVVL